MLIGHSISLHEPNDSSQLLLEDPISECGGEEAEFSGKVLYRASFEELARNYVQYETIIWVLISLLLVLAWGVGLFMLLCLPLRRYVLKKDIYSRKLFITPHEIVYKVTRPSLLPILGCTKIENRIPLHLVINIIIEQGCLQAGYGIHTFRIESVACGKATSVDELQIQGVSDPEHLRKVIVSEAAKNIQEAWPWKSKTYAGDGEFTPAHARSLTDIQPVKRFQSPSSKFPATTQPALEAGGVIQTEVLLHKLEEVRQSVKKIESLVGGSETLSEG